MDEPGQERARSRWRPGPAAIIPLIGLAIMVGGSIAILLGGGETAWAVAFIGLAIIVWSYGF